jgi:hypothetical protein
MGSELAMNAYVLLGNALSYLLTGAQPGLAARLHAQPGAIAAVYGKIEPLTPPQILSGIAELAPAERDLLGRSVRLCLAELRDETGSVLGLPEEVASETLCSLGFGESIFE